MRWWMTGRIQHQETRIHDMMDRLNVDKAALVRVKTTRRCGLRSTGLV
jgi:hypothetical protein